MSYESAGLQKNQILKECSGLRGIYRFTNKTNNKTYVGSGENLAKRFAIYFRKSELVKSKRPIHSAFLYYGYDNFRLDILATIPNNPASGVVSIESKGELVKLEQYYLDLLDPDYNILKVAYSLKGYVHTEETKVKLKASAAKRGRAVWVLNKLTDERFHFLTTREASEFLDTSPTVIRNAIIGGKIIKDNFWVSYEENYSFDIESSNKSAIKVLNTLTNKVIEYKTQSGVAKALNVSRGAVSMAVKSGKKIKDIYLITSEGSFTEEALDRWKVIEVFNTHTSKSEYFYKQTEVASFLDISSSAVTQAIKGGYPVNGIYLVTKKKAID